MNFELDKNTPGFIHRAFHSNERFKDAYSFFPFALATYAHTPELLSNVQNHIDEANKAGKQTVLYFGHDNDHPISEFLNGNPIVFRHSMSKNFNYQNEFIVPPNVNNFRDSIREIKGLGWKPVPKVSFMGWARAAKPVVDKTFTTRIAPAKGLVSSMVFPTPPSIGTVLRKRAIEIIETDKQIESNFTIFGQYFPHYSEEFKQENANEYLKSMSDTHYVLAIRGCGNFSFRLFETLAAGRIPIMVDTNQHLPFEDEIPWKELGVWVPFEKFNSINEYIHDFHNRLNKSAFDKLSYENEQIYEKYLSREAVIRQIERILTRLL
jgi:hypothetical protein